MPAKKTPKTNQCSDEKLANLLALRDAVIEDYNACEEACNDDSEFLTRKGCGVNCAEAFSTLDPLYQLAVKCL